MLTVQKLVQRVKRCFDAEKESGKLRVSLHRPGARLEEALGIKCRTIQRILTGRVDEENEAPKRSRLAVFCALMQAPGCGT